MRGGGKSAGGKRKREVILFKKRDLVRGRA